ncbi:MAG: 2-dehydropantoate 2-reductase [Burkholderiales bacterium]|nr:2-dehydropantoate 2-reductase [Burkholderiales bacterium]
MAKPFNAITVVGAGAVGSFYGALLARAGYRVTLIGRPAHVAAIRDTGLRLDMAGTVQSVPAQASTELKSVQGADLVLFCVKSTDTDAVAREMAPWLAQEAVVLSLQNGVENASTIARYVPNSVVPAVVYVATAMPEPGLVKHFGRGELVIGALDPRRSQAPDVLIMLQALVELFATAGIAVTCSEDVRAELWSKLMVNCAYNALSALGHAHYARIASLPEVRALQQSIVQEVVEVAAVEGVALSLQSSLEAVDRIAQTMPQQHSSTAQDMTRSKPSEMDHLNGFIARRGSELGVPTPINRTLHALVKLVEAGYG